VRRAKRCRRRREQSFRTVASGREVMQGMILHHAQAVEMTAMIPSHTQNKDLRSLGHVSVARSRTKSTS